MNAATVMPVSVMILDKEYRIACPEDEKNALLASANHLNRQMREIRAGGNVIGADRVAVMAALNATHDMLSEKEQREVTNRDLSARLSSLHERIDAVLREEV